MTDYISREAAIEAITEVATNSDRSAVFVVWPICGEVEENIKSIPAADVRPVVRGHWIGTKEAEDMGDIMKEFTCSVCGCCEWDCTESESFNFCPKCGADMRAEK